MKYKIEVASIDCLMLRMFDGISESNMPWLLAAAQRLRGLFGDRLVDLVPSYTTLMVHYDLRRLNASEARALVADALSGLQPTGDAAGRTTTLPVWYDSSVGPELKLLSRSLGVPIKRVIELHSSREYRVFALGFAPGYAYMGLLDEALSSPRLSTPRKHVAGGSVAVAERQTAVYPKASPGGWNVLGRTPAQLFDRSLEGYSLLQPGDRVRFVPIDRNEFIRLGGDDSPLEELV
ncbi:allophanate hydrolase subunit 1 [Pseudomonas sp. MOB-449]|nr:allophanate hydrolase subunit 1 [Pseudomonas sp. MOB-449]